MSGFDLAQSFYIDREAVQQAAVIYITSIDLYFYGKPEQGKTKTGIDKPGVTLYVGYTSVDGSPNFTTVNMRRFARVEYDNINVDTTGQTATTFTFNEPISVNTDKMCVFLIKFDGADPDFKLWFNKAGETQYGTTTLTQVSSGKVDGYLFKITNGSQITPETDADLSFKIRVARFTTTPTTFKITNRNYEILKIGTTTGTFLGGEPVYEKRANNTGTVSFSNTSTTVTGTGTSFNTVLTAGDDFVITDGTTGNTNIRKVVSVTNSTSLVVDVTPSFTNTSGGYYRTVTGTAYFFSNITDHIVMQDSTANSSVYLSVGSEIYGVDSGAHTVVSDINTYAVGAVIPNYSVIVPPQTSVNTTVNFANSDLSISSTTAETAELGVKAYTDKYPAVLASRTTEVTNGVPFKSYASTLKFSTNNPYSSPIVYEQNLDTLLETFEINNDDTNEYQGIGNASTRYVSRPVTLSNDQAAEDMKVYLRAYKPANTDIKVYAKFRNSQDIEAIDLKDWTELEPSVPDQVYSGSINKRNYIELEYNVPFEPAGTLVSGQFTTTSSCTVITGTSGAVNTTIAVGDVVRVYSASTPNTYFVDTVLASNTTTFTVSGAVTNSSLVGSGFLTDVVTRKNSAFLDVQNDNVLTYYNQSLATFHAYDSFAIKVVLLSENGYAVPFVDDLRAVAVSA